MPLPPQVSFEPPAASNDILSLQVPSGALLLDSAFEDAPVGISVVRAADGRRLRVNPAFCQFLGYSQAELLELPLSAVVHPDDFAQDLVERDAMHAGTIRSARRTKRYLHKGGRIIWGDFSSTLIRDAAGRPSHYVSLVTDVTARVEAERQSKEAHAEAKRSQVALRESQRAMSALLANLPGMAFRARNLPGQPYLFASDGALALTGYTGEELMRGEPAYGELVHPDDLAGMLSTVGAAVQAHRRFQLTYRIRTPGGDKHVWEQGCGVFTEDGRLRCIEGFVTDVTELWQAKQELATLNRTLEEQVEARTAQWQAANAELEAIAYSIAHDLRAPLTAIAGFGQVLEPALQRLDGREAHYLERILSNVRRMQEQTSALLSLARLSGVEITRERVDLSAVAHTLLAELSQRDPGRQARLQVQPGLACLGDRPLLAQLLANLLENAWKFSRRQPLTWIEVGSSIQDGAAVFHVRDGGPGFDMAHAGRLFTPFARLHGPAEFEGTGIGLAVVHKIVQRHGGRVWAESQPGEGTTIRFTLA